MKKHIKIGLFLTYIFCMFATIGNTSIKIEIKNNCQTETILDEAINIDYYQYIYSPSEKTLINVSKLLTELEEEDEENESQKSTLSKNKFKLKYFGLNLNQLSLKDINIFFNATTNLPLYILFEVIRL